jgi:hypothetical protein
MQLDFYFWSDILMFWKSDFLTFHFSKTSGNTEQVGVAVKFLFVREVLASSFQILSNSSFILPFDATDL